MDDQRDEATKDEAPELDLTTHTDEVGEDALQLTPSDSMAGVEFGDAFTVGEKTAGEVAAAKTTAEPRKPSKSSERLGDQQFVAALLGQPMPVSKKKKPVPEASNPSEPAPETGRAMPEAEPAAPIAASTPEILPEPSAIEPAPPTQVSPEPPPPEAEPAANEPSPSEVVLSDEAPIEVEIDKALAVSESPVEAPLEPPLAQTPWDAVQAPPTPKTRPLPPAGPTVSTAPITTLEPELLPTPQADPRDVATTVVVNDVPALPTIASPAAVIPTPPMPAAPIAVLSGVIVDTPAPAPEALARVLAAAPPVTPVEPVVAATPQVLSESAPKVPPEPTPVDNASLARDFAIPIPPAPKVAPQAKPSKRPQPTERIAVKAEKPAAEAMPAVEQPPQRTGAWWTLPLMFAGLAIIACALVVPVADENHRAAYELARIERDVAHFQQQADVNASFLSRVSNDPTLAERLAMRQLNMIRPDEKLAPLAARHDQFSMSPFALVNVDPPAPMPAYRPISGFLSRWFLDPKWQTYCVGIGLLMTAAGVVFGGGGEDDRSEGESEVAEPAAA